MSGADGDILRHAMAATPDALYRTVLKIPLPG